MTVTPLGETAIVVGAGIAGITCAAALAPHFERVLVLERDQLREDNMQRDGTPQGRHTHVLLAGGEQAMNELFPGFTADLRAAGAVAYRAGLDVLIERPGFDPFPRRDLGYDLHAMSRPLIESVLRRRLHAIRNVELRQGWRVLGLLGDAQRVTGVSCRHDSEDALVLEASLVVDATGRGAPTLQWLESHGLPTPPQTAIGIDIRYATAVFRMPSHPVDDWLGVMHFPRAPEVSRGAALLPVENGQWIVSVGTRHPDEAPADHDSFMAILEGLRTPTLHRALRTAEPVNGIVRYAFAESTWRHFDEMASLPGGLLAIGDAVCRFNPVYGQGMSVAAQQARELNRVLASESEASLANGDLARSFFQQIRPLIETPWSMSAVPDLVYPGSRGTRPADLGQRLQFAGALLRAAAKDETVHQIMLEVQHLLRPASAYRDPALLERVMAEMACSL
ncbi:MAG TPA: FAD-dependent monooxygenase [Burkholderiaceae bacterium]|nr:FAD-dependent monooxygenase [Burkholderiaceae bacterium]